MTTKFGGKQRRGHATGAPERRPAPLHHVVARDGEKGLENRPPGSALSPGGAGLA